MKIIFHTVLTLLLISLSLQLGAESEKSEAVNDLETIQQYFLERFPNVNFSEFANGVYALDEIARQNWEALEEFPPYEIHIDSGESYWNQHADIYKQCFTEGPGVKHLFPLWDDDLKTVVTLPYAVNLCRKKHKLPQLDYMQAEMNSLVAYMASKSRSNIIEIKVQNKDALAAYQRGKQYYFTRRGQLNFACHHCHFDNAGKQLRAETLGPALGQTTGWPTYRNKWGELGPLHRRYIGCNKQVRSAPLEAQSVIYRELEYFHSHMNNGLTINGPSVRR